MVVDAAERGVNFEMFMVGFVDVSIIDMSL
jgi:hypothetical protein